MHPCLGLWGVAEQDWSSSLPAAQSVVLVAKYRGPEAPHLPSVPHLLLGHGAPILKLCGLNPLTHPDLTPVLLPFPSAPCRWGPVVSLLTSSPRAGQEPAEGEPLGGWGGLLAPASKLPVAPSACGIKSEAFSIALKAGGLWPLRPPPGTGAPCSPHPSHIP